MATLIWLGEAGLSADHIVTWEDDVRNEQLTIVGPEGPRVYRAEARTLLLAALHDLAYRPGS